MIDASILSELSSLGLTGPQYQAVLSILSRLATTLQQEYDAECLETKRRQWRDNKRTQRGQSRDNPPLENKSNPPALRPTASGNAESVRDLVWTEGAGKVSLLGGQTERQAKAMVGRWLKSAPAGKVMEAIEAAEQARTRDPVAYITATLKPKVISFKGDWESGAARQLEERKKEKEKQVTQEEREANLAKLAKIRRTP